MTIATCLHCGGECRLTSGAEVYPHRPDLWEKPVWKCDSCRATVGCHPGKTEPMGYAADAATRRARMLLHERIIDPLWKNADRMACYAPEDERSRQVIRQSARGRVYSLLAKAMGIDKKDCHTGHFTIEQCRQAWRALSSQTPETIRAWAHARKQAAQEAATDRKRAKGKGRKGERRKGKRKASRDEPSFITGSQFCPKQSALQEVPW